MCTVLLRYAPGTAWPVLLGAVRDEFVDRAWDPPGRHWDGGYLGGRDRVAGGTWLAVDPGRSPAVAALLNGVRRPPPADGRRPSRGALPLAALRGEPLPGGAELARYDGFHLFRADPVAAELWTWDGAELRHTAIAPGDHVIVNAGLDVDTSLVRRLRAELARLPSPAPVPGPPPGDAWGDWLAVMDGGGVDPADPAALIVRRTVRGATYGSTSASLVGLSTAAARYDFTAPPGPGARWYEVPV